MAITSLFNSVAAATQAQEYQYLRKCTLIVSTASGNGLDLSNLHIKFSVKRSDTMTPNIADILVYNLSDETAAQIKKEFTKVVLQAGYESNYGVIFQGNIKQVIIGRESATDTFINIVAGDGDRAYNFSVVTATIAPGCAMADQFSAAIGAMSQKGVNAGFVEGLPTNQLPRGKVMYGNAKNYMRNLALSSGTNWSIQDESVNFVPLKTYLPGEAVVLTAKTGMIGTPQQTNEGVNVKCLLNPKIRISGRVQIDNASIAAFKINLATPNSPANIAPPLNGDGYYYVLVVEHQGDNRGVEWYTNLITLYISPATNPINSVQTNYGG
jgi:hypothetical protein